VEDALVALQGEPRLAHLQQAAQAAGNAALLAQRYASGLIDFASVLETQRTQLARRMPGHVPGNLGSTMCGFSRPWGVAGNDAVPCLPF
jgi:hypothetical protein